jgi:hypothetical protein
VYDGVLLDELAESVVDDYVSSMQTLLDLQADEVHAGHYRSFDRRYLRELVRKYIDSKQAPVCPSEIVSPT